MKKLVVICGPTATGKTSLGVKLCSPLAGGIDGEIVSIDSRQIYKEMEIGVGKQPLHGNQKESAEGKNRPRKTPEVKSVETSGVGELGGRGCVPPAESEFNIEKESGYWVISGVKTHLYDLISPDEELNAVQYARLAADRIEKIWSRGKVPFLVGGAGLYLEILLGMVEVAKVPKNPELREELSKLSQEDLVARLKDVAPERAETIDKNSPHRVMRAIEIAVGRASATGKTSEVSADLPARFAGAVARRAGKVGLISGVAESGRPGNAADGKSPDSDKQQGTVQVLPENIEPLWLGLNAPRKYLYNKIDRRVDNMVEAGLLDEVKSLAEKYGWEAPALDSIGYIEFKKYFEGKKDLEEQVQRVKYNTHAYARRQLTWFRRNDDIKWLDITDEDFEREAEKMVKSYLEN
mgnify:CR=1 FL=1